MNVSSSLSNDFVNDFVFNYTIQNFVKVEQIFIYGKAFMPAFPGDGEYKRQVYRSVCNLKQLIKHTDKTFLTKSIMEQLLASADFEFKLPFEKVREERVDLMMAEIDFILERVQTDKHLSF